MNEQKAPTMMNQHQHQHQQQMMSMNQNPQMMSMNQHQPQQQMMMNRGYGGLWAPPLPAPMDQLKFQNPNPNPNMKAPPGGGGGGGGFVSRKQQHQGLKALGPRSNWKGKKVNDKRKDGRRMENIGMSLMAGTSSGAGGITAGGGGGGYKPPMLNELQQQNRVKAQRFFTKKKFNHHQQQHQYHRNNRGKFAPRNTSSFIIRAKKSGGIAELVSPCQVTPAVLPTPMFSPSREVLVDMAKEEWGVDGYGSMKGLIRLRSPGREDEVHEGDEEEEEGGSSESDVEEHAEVERRLDHDLSRFEMIYPNYAGGMEYNNVLENRVDDQDSHIAQLEEENLILKERLFLMERELGDLRRRLQFLERQSHGGGAGINEEVVENESENDSESHGEAHSVEYNNEEFVGENTEGYVDVKGKEENNDVDGDVHSAKDDDQNVADVEGKEVKDDGASEPKKENMGEDVEVKEENNDGEVGKEEQNDETDTGGSESEAVADVPMDEVQRADNDGIGENQGKDEAAGNE